MNSKDLCLMPRLMDVIASGPNSLKIEGRNRSEYYVGSVTRAYRAAMDSYRENPDNFDPAPFMRDLEILESRGYTTAFFDGPVTPDAHNFETTRSVSEFHAAGVITQNNGDSITLELRNEICTGDTITFLLPHGDSANVRLPQIINAKTHDIQPKMSAGQHNSLIIPRAWLGDMNIDKFVPYVLAYKHKEKYPDSCRGIDQAAV